MRNLLIVIMEGKRKRERVGEEEQKCTCCSTRTKRGADRRASCYPPTNDGLHSSDKTGPSLSHQGLFQKYDVDAHQGRSPVLPVPSVQALSIPQSTQRTRNKRPAATAQSQDVENSHVRPFHPTASSSSSPFPSTKSTPSHPSHSFPTSIHIARSKSNKYTHLISLALLILISIFTTNVEASQFSPIADRRRSPYATDRLLQVHPLSSTSSPFASALLVDPTEPPAVHLPLITHERMPRPDQPEHLHQLDDAPTALEEKEQRQEAEKTPSQTNKSLAKRNPKSKSNAASILTTTTLAVAAAQASAAGLPMPFDTNLGSNFSSSSCPAFFNDLLSNSTFQGCHPLSLLLQVRSSPCPFATLTR